MTPQQKPQKRATFKLSFFQLDAVIEAIEFQLRETPHMKPQHKNTLRTALSALQLQRPEPKPPL